MDETVRRVVGEMNFSLYLRHSVIVSHNQFRCIDCSDGTRLDARSILEHRSTNHPIGGIKVCVTYHSAIDKILPNCLVFNYVEDTVNFVCCLPDCNFTLPNAQPRTKAGKKKAKADGRAHLVDHARHKVGGEFVVDIDVSVWMCNKANEL